MREKAVNHCVKGILASKKYVPDWYCIALSIGRKFCAAVAIEYMVSEEHNSRV